MMLYTLKNNKIRTWEAFSDGDEVVVRHGEKGGKITEKRYTAEAKNVGRANETTPESQAEAEVVSKITLQLKRGYYKTENEAQVHVPATPMKLQDASDHGHKLTYPSYLQPKLDGLRYMVGKNGVALSKAGEEITPPSHWNQLGWLAESFGGLDGEVYAGLVSEGGLELQEIVSAFRKENENTHKLKYYVYDIVDDTLPFHERYKKLQFLKKWVEGRGFDYIVVVPSILVHNEDEVLTLYNAWVEQGYEGAVQRNADSMYEFGKRSYGAQKRKPRKTAECRVISSRKDKNGQGVLTVEAINGEHKGNQFDLLMRKDSSKDKNYREYENSLELVEMCATITYSYEGTSLAGVATKPIGMAIRPIDEHFNGKD